MLPGLVPHRLIGSILLLLVLLCPVSAVFAEPVPCQLARIIAPDGQYEDLFGVAVATEGEWAFFGAEGDNPAGDNSGSVYVCRRSLSGDWSLEARLEPADGTAGDKFGSAVALDGDLLVVGARGDDDLGNGSGSVYIFQYSGSAWVEEAKLTAADGASGDGFGGAVDISGNRVLAGAQGSNSLGSNSGAAYIFDRVDVGVWSQTARLLASNGAATDAFGTSVSLDGDLGLVGAYLGDGLVADTGTAYVYRRTAPGVWLEEAMLQALDGTSWTYFGVAVSLDGDLALVGASSHLDQGAAYLFRRAGTVWAQESLLLAGDGVSHDNFGAAVAMNDGRALVGAPRNASGAIYLFCEDGLSWSQTWMAEPSGGAEDFGWSVDLAGGLLVAGAPVTDGVNSNTGAGFVFGLSSAQCGTIAAGLSCTPAFGTVPFYLTIDGELANSLPDSSRRVAAHLDLDLAGGLWFPNWRAGWVNLAPLDHYPFTFNLTVPAVGSVIGDNVIWILAEDVTPPPWNLPPYPPSGDTATDSCLFDADWPVEGKLLAPDGLPNDGFGTALAVEGDVLLVGAERGDGPALDCGSVYVYNRIGDEWVYQEEIFAGDSNTYDYFGCAIDIDGDNALIGASRGEGATADCGTAYIFRDDGSGWTEGVELTAWDGSASDMQYGRDVALDGSVALIGARWASIEGMVTGLAYVYRNNGLGWVAEERLRASDGETSDGFGQAVALSGGLAVVGAYRDDDQALNAGAAYVLRYDGASWVEEQKLVAADGTAHAEFGWDAAISGDRVALSAHHDAPFGYDVGAVYIFRYSGNTWYQEAKLTAGDAISQQEFGESLAFDGTRLLVGAPGNGDYPDTLDGAVYLFRRDGTLWEEVAKYEAYDGADSDFYGHALAIDGLTAFCSATGDDDNGSGSGSVYNTGSQ